MNTSHFTELRDCDTPFSYAYGYTLTIASLLVTVTQGPNYTAKINEEKTVKML